ncbi:MAG: hypothetical protein WCB53_08205 [Terriglobales bacterium]|jgi:hypothetical protein
MPTSATDSATEVLSSQKSGSDIPYYLGAIFFGAAAAWVDVKVGDLLLTATIVVSSCILLGFLRPRRPWRWFLIIGVCIPVAEWLAYFFLTQKPTRAQVYESFLAFLPGIAGSVGGALGRTVVNNLFEKPPDNAEILRARSTAPPKS